MAPVQEPTFWAKVWVQIKKYGRLLMAPLPALLIIGGAIVLVVLGAKNVQIGGILGKLFGKTGEGNKTAVDLANSVPEHRVDPKGNIIPVGIPDSQGQTQAVVVPIESPGLFSNPTTVTIVPPNATAPVTINLPDGVRSHDVDKVIIVKPEVYAVTVKDSSPISAQHVDDLLKKYGG
jgi:hypothetical protein